MEWDKRQNANKKKKKSRGPDWSLDPLERKLRSWDL